MAICSQLTGRERGTWSETSSAESTAVSISRRGRFKSEGDRACVPTGFMFCLLFFPPRSPRRTASLFHCRVSACASYFAASPPIDEPLFMCSHLSIYLSLPLSLLSSNQMFPQMTCVPLASCVKRCKTRCCCCRWGISSWCRNSGEPQVLTHHLVPCFTMSWLPESVWVHVK